MIHYGGAPREVTLRFEPYQSIMLRVSKDGEVGVLDVGYVPETPKRDQDLEQ